MKFEYLSTGTVNPKIENDAGGKRTQQKRPERNPDQMKNIGNQTGNE